MPGADTDRRFLRISSEFIGLHNRRYMRVSVVHRVSLCYFGLRSVGGQIRDKRTEPTPMSETLTAAKVRAVRTPGKYTDQHGLILRVAPGGSKQWIWRGTIRGTPGLGARCR